MNAAQPRRSLVAPKRKLRSLRRARPRDGRVAPLASETEPIYRTLVELSPEAIAVHDGTRVLFVNRAGTEMLGGKSAEEIVGQPVARFVDASSRAAVAERIRLMRQTGLPAPLDEEVFVRLDGSKVDVDVAAAPLFFHRAPAFVVIARDVTERKRSREVYEQYLHAISHDLRTPLAAMLMRAQILERQCAKQGTDASSAKALVRAGHRMMSMLEELRDVAKIETGQLQLRREPIELRAFFVELLASVDGALSIERVRVEIEDGLPRVSADAERLERIALNLLSNALKYSPEERPVHVCAHARDREVVISIEDEGPGVSEALVPRIFERFVRAEDSKREGLGLGLHIAKAIVEAHGGRIWLEKAPGRGACFRFSLPRA